MSVPSAVRKREPPIAGLTSRLYHDLFDFEAPSCQPCRFHQARPAQASVVPCANVLRRFHFQVIQRSPKSSPQTSTLECPKLRNGRAAFLPARPYPPEEGGDCFQYRSLRERHGKTRRDQGVRAAIGPDLCEGKPLQTLECGWWRNSLKEKGWNLSSEHIAHNLQG